VPSLSTMQTYGAGGGDGAGVAPSKQRTSPAPVPSVSQPVFDSSIDEPVNLLFPLSLAS
jgi:hypothetical protein